MESAILGRFDFSFQLIKADMMVWWPALFLKLDVIFPCKGYSKTAFYRRTASSGCSRESGALTDGTACLMHRY